MTSTETYRKLLVKFAPAPIRSAKEYRRALVQLEELMVPHPDEAHSRLIELLATLVEQYERRDEPNSAVDPAEMLAHLLETTGIKSAEVAKATGIPPATLSNVLARRRGISKANAQKLANFFGVSPLSFLADQTAAERPPGRTVRRPSGSGPIAKRV